MGPYIVYYLIGSVVAIPFLAWQVFRTRRDLSELREELRKRGVIGAAGGERRPELAAPRDEARPLSAGGDAASDARSAQSRARIGEGEPPGTDRAP
jgi:hypothetical protein